MARPGRRVREVLWKGERGEGTVFRWVDAITREPLSSSLYVSYRLEGKECVVSVRNDNLKEARQLLSSRLRNKRNAEEALDIPMTPAAARVTVGDLLDANLRRAEEAGLASARGIRYRTETLKGLLGDVRAVNFDARHVDGYRKTRRAQRVGDTSIRRELEILNRAFNYAVQRRVLRFAPFIEKPTEDRVRQQEIPLERFPEILNEIAKKCVDVRDFMEWLFLTATRPKGARDLRWDWFDSKAWKLKVPAEKGGNSREFAIEGRLRKVIERRIASRRLDCAFIFSYRGRKLAEDRTRRVFYEALKTLSMPAGRSTGFILYDTKKTAAGLLVDSGLSEAEAMAFSGHRTPSMFQRYVIRNSDRHRESVRKRDAYLEQRLAEKSAANADKVVELPKESEAS